MSQQRQVTVRDGLVTFDVVQVNWLLYRVYKVTHSAVLDYVYLDKVRWFFSLDKAEACAKGLAEGTWLTDGPIMASFEVPRDKEETNATAATNQSATDD